MGPTEATRARVEELEGRFAALIEGLQVGVVVQGPASEILLANAKALELLGMTDDQLRGRSSLDPGWDIARADGSSFPGEERPVIQALRLRAPVRDVVIGVRRSGEAERVWLLVTAMPQLRGDGSVVQVVATFTDITAQRRVEATARAQVETIRALSTPVIPIDEHTLIAPIVGAIDHARADQLLEALLAALVRTRSRVAIVDLTGVPALDEVAGAALLRCGDAARLVGATVLLTGVRPAVAAALVDHDERFAGLRALGTLQQGVAAARALLARR
jgi:PAS domain S-box-containing protein